MEKAFRVLYPDGDAPGFRPNVADFFKSLEIVAIVHEGRKRLPLSAGGLLTDLRLEIARGLEREVADAEFVSIPHYNWTKLETSPDVVVTTNWDPLVERAAYVAGRKVRLSWPVDSQGRHRKLQSDELIVLKLHGSTDWGLAGARNVETHPRAKWYSHLRAAIGDRPRFPGGRPARDLALRYRRTEGLPLGSPEVGFEAPLMATMAVGKHANINVLDSVWDDAYWSLSSAKEIDIVGYSFPADDLEIQTLLRVTTRRAAAAEIDPAVNVKIINPAPEAHERARGVIGPAVDSDYREAAVWDGP